MRKFEFRLERVLRVRRRLEDIQRAETLEQENRLRSVEKFQAELSNEEGGLRDELVPARGKRWGSSDQQVNYRYLERLIQEVAQAGADREKEDRKLESMRAELIERSRGRRTVERLRERRMGEWRDEVEKEDRAELDEIGAVAVARRRERGSTLLTTLLLLLTVGAGVFCYVVWRNWLSTGSAGFDLLTDPIESIYRKQARREVLEFEARQSSHRNRREAELIERAQLQPEMVEVEQREGYRRTMDSIRQQQESLRRREEEVVSNEIALERSLRDFRADLNILTDIRATIDERLTELKALEEKRTREMSEERRRNLEALMQTVKAMREKAAADLLLSLAVPDPADTGALPFPPGEQFEGIHLVVELLQSMNPKDRAAIFDKMVSKSPSTAAMLADMLDNVRSGLEPDASDVSSARQVP